MTVEGKEQRRKWMELLNAVWMFHQQLVKETAEETLETYWGALDKDNRISLAVKEVALDGSSSRIVFKNKY